MSGASGQVPAAIHVTPEAVAGSPIARIRDGDIVRVDATAGAIDVLVGDEQLGGRRVQGAEAVEASWTGTGRELFAWFRSHVGAVDEGASVIPRLVDGAA